MPENITVVPYNAEWPELFRRLGRELRAALQHWANRIDHIEHQPPFWACPPSLFSDIQISVVTSLDPMLQYKAALESIGFDWRVKNPDLTKRRIISGKSQGSSGSISMCASRAVGVNSFRYSSVTTCGHIQRTL